MKFSLLIYFTFGLYIAVLSPVLRFIVIKNAVYRKICHSCCQLK